MKIQNLGLKTELCNLTEEVKILTLRHPSPHFFARVSFQFRYVFEVFLKKIEKHLETETRQKLTQQTRRWQLD